MICVCKVAGMCVVPGSWDSACICVLVPVSTPFFKNMLWGYKYVFCSLVLAPIPLSLRGPIFSCITALKDMHHEFLTQRMSLLGVKSMWPLWGRKPSRAVRVRLTPSGPLRCEEMWWCERSHEMGKKIHRHGNVLKVIYSLHQGWEWKKCVVVASPRGPSGFQLPIRHNKKQTVQEGGVYVETY